MGFQGTLKTMGLPDVLQWLAQSRKTGTLFVRREELENRFYVENGAVTAARSMDAKGRLGRYLVERGLVREPSLDHALELSKTRSAFIGQILVELRCLSAKDVEKAVRFKIQERLLEILEWSDGEFNFVEHGPPERSRVPVAVDVPDLLLHSMQQLDESDSGNGSKARPTGRGFSRDARGSKTSTPGAAPRPAAARPASVKARPLTVGRLSFRLWGAAILLTVSVGFGYRLFRASGPTTNRHRIVEAQPAPIPPTTPPNESLGVLAPAPARDEVESLVATEDESWADGLDPMELPPAEKPPSPNPSPAVETQASESQIPVSELPESRVEWVSGSDVPESVSSVAPDVRPPNADENIETEAPTQSETPAIEAEETERVPPSPSPPPPTSPALAVEPEPSILPPTLIRQPRVEYPWRALRLQQEATVAVRVLVDESGKVVEAAIASDQKVERDFVDAALAAARTAQYRPAMKGAHPLQSWTTLRLVFRIQ